MHQLLANPVYQALISGDKAFSFGTNEVKYFNEEMSPFAGFAEGYAGGFSDLYDLLPDGRKILYATISPHLPPPPGWQLQMKIGGLQFIYAGEKIKDEYPGVVPLNESHVEEMTALVKLTKPGPFGKRTIDFGSYFGIFEEGKLVAMTGQRLHVQNYTELSAVCTHPDHLGKGYASILLKQQLQIILGEGQIPFLHVRDDNGRAIAVYERLGFARSRPMNFYFMKKL